MADLRDTWSLWARPLVLSISLLLTPLSGPARHAYAEDVQQNALARSLFEEGVVLSDAGDNVGAADRFSRAYSLKPTSGIAFNWASVLAESGKLLQAQDLLLAVARDPAADAQLKSAADALLRTLTPRVPRLRLHVEPPEDTTLSVLVDLSEWPRAVWDIASPIDPGPHTLVLRRDGAGIAQAELTLAEGESRELSLAVPREPQAEPAVALPVAAAPASALGEERAHRQPLYKSWLLWTAVGAVVVGGVVTGIVLGTRGEARDAAPVRGNASPGVLTW